MASLDHLFDGSSGALGTLVFYQKNGKGYVRTRPAQYRDKKSPAQLAQRQRLQVMNGFLRSFREALRVTFAAEAQGRTALQAAQSYNMLNALEGEYPDIRINKSKALVSKGPLPLPSAVRMTPQEQGVLLQWDNGVECTPGRSSDTLVVLVLPQDGYPAAAHFTPVLRSGGQYLLSLGQTPEVLPDIWIAFRNPQQTLMSDSMWVG